MCSVALLLLLAHLFLCKLIYPKKVIKNFEIYLNYMKFSVTMIVSQSREDSVKCSADGELPLRRKRVCVAVVFSHPAVHIREYLPPICKR